MQKWTIWCELYCGARNPKRQFVESMGKEELDAKMLFNECSRVLQSYKNFRLDVPTSINVIKIRAPPKGGGRSRKVIGFLGYLKSKKSVISARQNNDVLYCARSILVAKAMADNMPIKNLKERKQFTRCDCRNTKQYEEALKLHQSAGVPPRACFDRWRFKISRSFHS